MAFLTLVKHSSPKIVPSRPANEWELSDEGISRCAWLADKLTKADLSSLYSSPEPKARETAEIVGQKLGIETTVLEGLQENDRTGFPYIDNETEWKQRFRDFFEKPTQRVIGDESANEALSRFSQAVSQIVERHPQQNIGIVAHGTVISLFTAHYNGVSPFEIWDSLNPLPAFVSVRVPGYEIEIAPRGFPKQRN